MKLIVILLNLITVILVFSCSGDINAGKRKLAYYTDASIQSDTFIHKDKNAPNSYNKPNSSTKEITIKVGVSKPDEVVQFAQSLIGTPYVYGSTNPQIGFDCSGFITYVFNHFNIKVPRSSSEFVNVGETVSQEDAKPGDLILFTSPSLDNSNTAVVGHLGLITSHTNGLLTFIHSTSGKAMGVTQTPLNVHYQKRFLRICRIFPKYN